MKCFLLTLSLLTSTLLSLSAQMIEGSFAAPTNIHPDQCPCIMPDNSIVFEVKAPHAQKVQIDLGKKYDMVKGADGLWTVRTEHTKNAVKEMQERGLEVDFATFPGDHEWQVWRKSLYDFASRVFK